MWMACQEESMAPDLSAVGSYLGVGQIQTAINDPKADPENSIMPKFSLSPEEIKAISYFLRKAG